MWVNKIIEVGQLEYEAFANSILDLNVLIGLFSITVGFFAIRWFLHQVYYSMSDRMIIERGFFGGHKKFTNKRQFNRFKQLTKDYDYGEGEPEDRKAGWV